MTGGDGRCPGTLLHPGPSHGKVGGLEEELVSSWDLASQVTRDPRVMCPTGPGLPVGRLQQGLQLAGGGGGVPQADGPGVLCGLAAGPSGHPGDP